MQWRKCPPVQTVSALLLHGNKSEIYSTHLNRLNERGNLFANAMISMGADWLVIEGNEDRDKPGELLLPSLPDARPLYKAGEKIYCAVGFELDAPEPMRALLLAQLTERLSLQGSAVLMPNGIAERPIEVFELSQARALNEIDLSEFL